MVDRDRFRATVIAGLIEVLHNLLSNAAKFSWAGTPISVRIEHHGDQRP